MDGPLVTPVTVSCDHPGCPEVDLTVALALEHTGDLAEVRRRALCAAVENAETKGWSTHLSYGPDQPALIMSAYCPLHRRARVLL